MNQNEINGLWANNQLYLSSAIRINDELSYLKSSLKNNNYLTIRQIKQRTNKIKFLAEQKEWISKKLNDINEKLAKELVYQVN